jgi:tetratricopeptide (TPR) repeat protein
VNDDNAHISASLDLVQAQILKTKFLLGLGQNQEANEYFYGTFTDIRSNAHSLDILALEAEILLKTTEDVGRAKQLLDNVLEHDNLNFKALILKAHLNLFYEGEYQKALDYLMRAKLINSKSHELWNLFGHCYSLIDGSTDNKADECFLEASAMQLEYPEALTILEVIPAKVSMHF